MFRYEEKQIFTSSILLEGQNENETNETYNSKNIFLFFLLVTLQSRTMFRVVINARTDFHSFRLSPEEWELLNSKRVANGKPAILAEQQRDYFSYPGPDAVERQEIELIETIEELSQSESKSTAWGPQSKVVTLPLEFKEKFQIHEFDGNETISPTPEEVCCQWIRDEFSDQMTEEKMRSLLHRCKHLLDRNPNHIL